MSLSHHCRVHKKGVPHVAFRKDYMSQLRAMLPLPAAQLAQRGSRSRTVRDWRSCRRQWAVINDRPDVRSLADAYPGSGDTHTNRTSSDGIKPAGRGGSYGVRLPAPSAARGNGVRRFGTGGYMFHNEGQCGRISTSRT